MPDLENFRIVVFRAVAEQLSFRKAAEALYLTQPAVSLQIKALEESLGVQLFDRTGTRGALTPSGEVLLRYARQVHALSLEAESEIIAASGDRGGELSLGASTTIAQYVLPSLLGDFRKLYPRFSIRLISGNTEEIARALESQSIDLGLIEGPARSREVKTEPFLLDEMVMIVPIGHEWTERASVPLAEIPSAALILREHGSGSRDVVQAVLQQAGLRRTSLSVSMELDSTEAIKSAVEAALGIGFVSRWALAKDTRLDTAFRVVPIENLRIAREFLIARLAGPEPHGPAAEFRRFLLSRTPAKLHARSEKKPGNKPHKKSK